MKEVFREISEEEKIKFEPIDTWVPEEKDLYFKHVKGKMIIPVADVFKIEDQTFNIFILNTKRCYDSDEVRNHCAHYINYFLKFYDDDKELLAYYAKIKYMIDYENCYDMQAFIDDLKRYMFNPSMMYKLHRLNRDNYTIDLIFRANNNESIIYDNSHGRILMKISFMINMIIPLITHFIYIKNVGDISFFILSIYDYILGLFDVDIYNKLYESCLTNIEKSLRSDKVLWDKQDIRGKNIYTQAKETVNGILLNVVPKYCYNKNLIHYNYTSIRKNIGYQVIDIGYEYVFISLSGSKRDQDNNSDIDRFESYLISRDENLALQSRVTARETMKELCIRYGPIQDEEVKHYKDRIGTINSLQKELVFNLFYKEFGDPVSIKSINMDDYIKLIIIGKRILVANGLYLLGNIIGSKIKRVIVKKNLNKREHTKLINSPNYYRILNKYRHNEKIEKHILSLIATLFASEFEGIDFYDKSLDGVILPKAPIEIISEQLLMYIDLI